MNTKLENLNVAPIEECSVSAISQISCFVMKKALFEVKPDEHQP